MDLAHSAIHRSMARAALLAAAAAILGSAGVAAWLREGLPFAGADIARRVAYLSQHQRAWTWGWLLAAFGAVLVVNLYRAMATHWQNKAGTACRLAMILATAGLAVDLSGIAIWILVAPGLGAEDLGLVERIAGAMSLFAAKILYAGAGGLLTLAGWREMGKPLTALATGVWLAGFWVAAATGCRCASAQIWSLMTLVMLFVLWSALFGLRLLGIGPGKHRQESPQFTSDPRD
jgi:hypothetical protein